MADHLGRTPLLIRQLDVNAVLNTALYEALPGQTSGPPNRIEPHEPD